MGLKSDFEESLSVWRSSSPLMRVWLVLSLFLASGSIASLSETFVKWKGFLLDAFNFYSARIVVPLHTTLASLFHVQIPRHVLDASILFMLIAAPNVRIAVHSQLDRDARLSALSILGSMVLCAAFVLWEDGLHLSFGGAVTSLVIMASLATYYHVREGGAARFLWFLYFFAPLALIGVLGALNAAIAK